MHQKLLIVCNFWKCLNKWILGQLLLFMICCDYLMERCSLLLDVKIFGLISWSDFIQINLVNFLLLLLTELLKEFSLALQLINNVFVFLNLLLIIFDVLLNSEHYVRWIGAHLFFERSLMCWMMVEIVSWSLVVFVIIFCLNTICMHYNFLYLYSFAC